MAQLLDEDVAPDDEEADVPGGKLFDLLDEDDVPVVEVGLHGVAGDGDGVLGAVWDGADLVSEPGTGTFVRKLPVPAEARTR